MKLPRYSSLSKLTLSSALLLAGFTQSIANAQNGNPVGDPIPGSVPMGDLTIKIEEFSRVPQSFGGGQGWARINHLKPDGMGRLFVNDLRGPMYLVSEDNADLYLDLEAEIGNAFYDTSGLGSGFTSFAFHPEFATNGKLYTAHSEGQGAGTPDFDVIAGTSQIQGVITEWTATDPTATTFVGTRREVLRVSLVATIHGFQEISFNTAADASSADYGNLYICIGDSGTTINGYPENTQRLDSVLGTILRIDPMGSDSANGQYGIPTDNPYADDGDDNTLGEIYAIGFRNPHRISWDTNDETKMFSGDIGERMIEEINLIEPGKNYGWNLREGTWVINEDWANNPDAGENDEIFALPDNDASLGFTYPVAMYDHDEGPAVVGGYVYRGPSNAAAQGHYIFGDIRSGNLYSFDTASMTQGELSTISRITIDFNDRDYDTIQDITDSRESSGNRNPDIRFGYDEDNEFYILSKFTGRIYKMSESIVIPQVPKLINISTRGQVKTGSDVLIGGFVIGGTEEKSVLIQGIGSELTAINPDLAGSELADPEIRLYDSTNTEIAFNDDWEDENALEKAQLMNTLGSTVLTAGSQSASLLRTLPAGAYTAIVTGKGGTTGIALVEAYSVPDGDLPVINLVLNKPATATNDYGGAYVPASAVDGDESTRWASQDVTEPFLEVDIGTNVTFNSIRILEHNDRIRAFDIEYFDGTDWNIAFSGGNIDGDHEDSFDAVTGSKVRLQITESTAEPTIYEFQVFLK